MLRENNWETIEVTLYMEIKGVEKPEHATEIYEMLIRPKFNVVEEITREYPNGGLSYVCLLEESTLAVHYYPEYMTMTVIVSSCGHEEEVEEKYRAIVAELMYLYEVNWKVLYFTTTGIKELVNESDIPY